MNRADGWSALKAGSLQGRSGNDIFISKILLPGFDTTYIMQDKGQTRAYFFARTVALPDNVTDKKLALFLLQLYQCQPA